MKSLFNLKSKIFMAVVCFMGISLVGCQQDDDVANVPTTDSTAALAQLAQKYNVKIDKVKDYALSNEDLNTIEQEIINLKNKFKEFNQKDVKLTPEYNTRATESVELSAWAFNLTWLKVVASVVDDNSFNVDSWFTGVTIYSYEQKGLTSNFSSGRNQKNIDFNFMAVGTVSLLEEIVKISVEGKVTGSINLITGTGSLYVDGY